MGNLIQAMVILLFRDRLKMLRENLIENISKSSPRRCDQDDSLRSEGKAG